MNIFDFENRLKSHTTNSRGKVDFDKLLSDLDIKPQPRYRFGYKHFFFASIALIGLAYLTHSYILNESVQSEISTTAQVTEATAPTTASIKKESKTILNNNTLSEEKTTLAPNTNLESITTLSRFAHSNQTQLDKAELNKNETQTTSPKIQKIITKDVIFKKEIKQEVLTPSTDVPASNATSIEMAESTESKIIAASNSSNTEYNKNQNSELERFAEPVSLIAASEFKLLDIDYGVFNNKKTECPKFSDRVWHLYIIPEVGYTFPMKTLSLNDEAYSFVFTERQAHETTVEGINASLFLQFKNQLTGLYVKPGVSYSKFTERINFIQTDITIDTIIRTIVEEDPDGEVISEVTSEEINRIETDTEFEVYYRLHQFELPVAVGYSFSVNRFNIDIEAGLKLNFLQTATGQILSKGGEFVNLNRNSGHFKNSVGLGFFGGILLKREINSRAELYVAPRFSFNTLSYSANENPINQKYSVLGLHAGVVYAIY